MLKKEKKYSVKEIATIVYDVLDEELNNLTKDENLSEDMKFTSNLFKMSIVAAVIKKLKEEE